MVLKRLKEIPIIKTWRKNRLKKKFKGSAEYWEERYAAGGNSGEGSYEKLAEFKADFLNNFVKNNSIQSVLEFGCGDGNQLSLAQYPTYIGFDVSPTVIQKCIKKFERDKTKSFNVYNTLTFSNKAELFKADLTLSLDVLFHLTEKEVFEAYIRHLFNAATRYVIIYATDFDQQEEAFYPHENRRRFTEFISGSIKDWKIKEIVANKYPFALYGPKGSDCSFYIYYRG